jgi:nitroreductase
VTAPRKYNVGGVLLDRPFKVRRLGHFGFNLEKFDQGLHFLAARALGYGGVLTAYHRYAEAELRAVLEIPDSVFIAATIALGTPSGRHGPVRRHPLRHLVYEDGWESPADWAVDPDGARFTADTA